ncbi:MAG: hypothetical protein WA137_02170 [Methanothrix sp.]
MPRSRYADRIATVYFPSPEELQEWAKDAKSAGCSLSKYIIEMVSKSRNALRSPSSSTISKDLEEVRKENRMLKKDNQEKALLLEHYETELFKARNKAYLMTDSQEAAEYDTRLVELLRHGKTIDSYRILTNLGIDPGDSDAVKMVKNQLEELRRFNLVKETPAGWRWVD